MRGFRDIKILKDVRESFPLPSDLGDRKGFSILPDDSGVRRMDFSELPRQHWDEDPDAELPKEKW